VVISDSPHEGQAIHLIQGKAETSVVGSNLTTKSGEKALKLDDDDEVDDEVDESHIWLDLVVAKLTADTVTDKSNGGTCINRDIMKNRKTFINDQIKIGDSILEGRPLLNIWTELVLQLVVPISNPNNSKSRTSSQWMSRGSARKVLSWCLQLSIIVFIID
jgi:hypothetical protein